MNALSPATRPAFAPGVYPDLPMDVYQASEGLSCSTLKRFAEAPAKALVKREETPSLARGTLIHTAVLEPHLLEALYCVTDLERISAREKATQAEMERAEGRKLVKRAEWEDALRLRDAVQAHFEASALLSPGIEVEHSFFWDDAETGLRCKGRADAWKPDWRVIGDVKTTRDASGHAFGRDAGKLRYFWSDFQYRRGFEAASGFPVEAFVFIAVEPEEPFLIQCFETPADALAAAERQVRDAMRGYAECARSGHWPGHPPGINPLEIPAWCLA